MNGDPLFVGIDVGTGSTRAGVFDAKGKLLASARREISLYLEGGETAEQSSNEIWSAICASVREALAVVPDAAERVAGIGFDATCSLVLVEADGTPVSVSSSGDDERNIIVWMDHRAVAQAERINAGGHRVLDFLGGAISPEMETPKLLWLSENLPRSFARAHHFFDLADYLTWRATGDLRRSLCTVTCKWTYLAHERRWDPDYFRAIGLDALADEGFSRIGTSFADAGTALGRGLTVGAAAEFGLRPGTAVGAGLIDAHAGGIATVGAFGADAAVENVLGYVMGTSACTMATATARTFVPGVWGPYFSAMVPGLWLLEGGQSAAGAAIDHLVRHHPAYAAAEAAAREKGCSVAEYLAARASEGVSLSSAVDRAEGLHVVPDFNGNRSPHADPLARAVVSGLGLDGSLDSLVGLYIAGICGLGYGLRQIVEALAASGVIISHIVTSGGAAKGLLVRQLLADTAGLPVASVRSEEPVLLGSAMLGAVAAGAMPSVAEAMRSMTHLAEVLRPSPETLALHERRRIAFKLLQVTEAEIRKL